jgi:ABC-type glutathione transport system ATPase component
LRGKKLSYRAGRGGLQIQLESGETLGPEQLSSGECHIILLLTNALLARDGSKLFLIDEPELSLNVKWQRQVIRSLLACTEGSGVQFVIATHSIELLSGYRDNVERLVPRQHADA